MLAFVLSFLFGVGQVCLTERLISAFNKKDAKKSLVFFAVKILAYAIGIGVIVLNFVWHIGLVLCGFAAGVPIAAIGLFVCETLYKDEIIYFLKRVPKTVVIWAKKLLSTIKQYF